MIGAATKRTYQNQIDPNHDSSCRPPPTRRVMVRKRNIKHSNLNENRIWNDIINQSNKRNSKRYKKTSIPKKNSSIHHDSSNRTAAPKSNQPTVRQMLERANFQRYKKTSIPKQNSFIQHDSSNSAAAPKIHKPTVRQMLERANFQPVLQGKEINDELELVCRVDWPSYVRKYLSPSATITKLPIVTEMPFVTDLSSINGSSSVREVSFITESSSVSELTTVTLPNAVDILHTDSDDSRRTDDTYCIRKKPRHQTRYITSTP
ncbi:uncharacterized protein LOC144422046 [Styela clava]